MDWLPTLCSALTTSDGEEREREEVKWKQKRERRRERENVSSNQGLLPDDLGEQDAVGSVVVRGVVVTPELWPGEREVPELVDKAPHPLLLCLQPLVIAIPCLVGGREEGREKKERD